MRLRALLAVVLCAAAVGAPPSGDPDTFGANLQRTMTLLATSNVKKPNPVRILVYGQSISQQSWWRTVADTLRKRYPDAALTIENRAIGGFSSPLLIKTAEHDLYSFYPDLVIFHVYGAEAEYEQIIANIRKRTTAEVLLFSDHVTWMPEPGQPVDEKARATSEWHDKHSFEWLPNLAFRYGCELAEIRRPWAQYLKENNLRPADLLRDNVHLNDRGNELLAELVLQHFQYRPELSNARWKDYTTDHTVTWEDRKARIEFEGTRVDLTGLKGKVRVKIDGKRPTQIPDVFTITRPTSTVGVDWPAVIHVSSDKPLIEEKWTARILEINDAADTFRFEVIGEKTGHDGYGTSGERFVSKSKRVIIDPADWHLKRGRDYTRKPVPQGFEIHWEVRAQAVDEWTHGEVTVAQGLAPGRHRMELSADEPAPGLIARAYKPPVDAQLKPSVVELVRKDEGWQLIRNTTPYFIRGAVGTTHLKELAVAGGNSIRATPALLDKAHTLGLTVLANLPAGKPRLGFDYADTNRLQAQEKEIREIVSRHKDHPALLMWSLGNELEIGTTPEQRVPIWKEINRLVGVIRSIDPNHPVLTPIGDAYKTMLAELNEHCPALDAVGLNSYADMLTLPEDVRKQGWTRPYVITEFGPRGHWQVAKTSWKVPIEDSSTEKAGFYLRAYRHAVEHQQQSVGAYVFHWAQHHEKTHTWYGMFLPDGTRMEPVDVMHYLWRKEWPENRAPSIGSVRIDDADGIVQPGAVLNCSVEARAATSVPLIIRWELRPDVADDPNVGGDRERPVEPIAGALVESQGTTAKIRIPAAGKFRIFAYAYSAGGGAATANVPLLAIAPAP